jgi:hypothetical protein
MSYLSKFLEAFVENETLGRILLATTRTPYFPELLSAGVDIYRLNIIRDEYIREIIYQYLEDVENRDALFSSEDLMNGLVSVAAGYPTAAKRIASFVRVRPAALLLEPERIRSFQRGFAESILRPTIDSITPLQSLLLQVLTVIGEPVSVSDFIVDPGIWTEKRARIES